MFYFIIGIHYALLKVYRYFDGNTTGSWSSVFEYNLPKPKSLRVNYVFIKTNF